MPIPEGTLHLMGVLAAAASAGSFLRFDDATRFVMAAFAMLVWFAFGFAAYDVCPAQQCPGTSVSIESLALLGFAAGVVMVVFTVEKGLEMAGIEIGQVVGR